MSQRQTSLLGSTNSSDLDRVLGEYLDVLDKWQQEVHNIRMAHHKVWRDNHVSERIIQHRAGSRVECQTRILSQGKDTDVDFMFELDGVQVNSDDNCQGIYWKPSKLSPVFGKAYITENYRETLWDKHVDVFTDDAFEWDSSEGAYLLIPGIFKQNVVAASKFEFSIDKNVSQTSPSIAGKGVISDYDTVPCLKLAKWPAVTHSWLDRGPSFGDFLINTEFKNSVMDSVPLFLVPTGNPMSTEKEMEFRLSFSMVEIKIFDRILPEMRKRYGIAKYVFKKLFNIDYCDLLSSYHIKTLFMWLAEELTIKRWQSLSPLTFIKLVLTEIESCTIKRSIKHYFVKECDIFPHHKFTSEKCELYSELLKNKENNVVTAVIELLYADLNISFDQQNAFSRVESELRTLASPDKMEIYIRGYLTRLLSLITFSLFENKIKGTLFKAVENICIVLESYKDDKHLTKIINVINVFLASVQTRNEVILRLIPCENTVQVNQENLCITVVSHAAFELYASGNFQGVESMLKDYNESTYKQGGIGVSVTKLHKMYELDFPLRYVIQELEKRHDENCPRFYIDPYLMIKHLMFQSQFKKNNGIMKSESMPIFQNYISEMEDITNQLSNRVPYIGKLSYKYSGVFLLYGYLSMSQERNFGLHFTVPGQILKDSFNQRLYANNFDLR